MSTEATQPYQRIVLDVREKIHSGLFTAGTKLPSTRELAETYAVAPGTVQRALAELRTAGLIYSHQGLGSFVTDSASETVGGNAEDGLPSAVRALQEQVRDLTARIERIEKRGGA
ncbi:winged helix-turn-helix domain-containing protein [Streptomyces sp. NPDC049744]|uniref:GntR family transcriptional regulator n=1 Tax=Streptomyces sp. NPDC049744 TaxID=3154359 RepID=UPI00341AC676